MTPEPDDLALVRRPTALSAGVTDGAIRRARESGSLVAVARGVYLPASELAALDGVHEHRVRVVAVLPSLAGEPVVSHISAAVLHRLPFAHSSAPRVHITRVASTRSQRGPGVHAHRGALAADEIVTIAGLPVTSAARTVLDCARMLTFPHAVAVADAALHRGLTTRAELAELLRRHRRLAGNRQAAAVIGAADERSASTWESHSRVLLGAAGWAPGVLAMPVISRAGAVLGRAAFGDPDRHVIGGYRPDPGASSTADETWAERELPGDAMLADAGYAVIRWGWRDLAVPPSVIGRWTAAGGAG